MLRLSIAKQHEPPHWISLCSTFREKGYCSNTGKEQDGSFFYHLCCWWLVLFMGGKGSGERRLLFPVLSLCPCLFLSYSTIITTKNHNMEIKILETTILPNYVLNPNMKLRILLHTIWPFPSALNWHFGLCSTEEPWWRRRERARKKGRFQMTVFWIV